MAKAPRGFRAAPGRMAESRWTSKLLCERQGGRAAAPLCGGGGGGFLRPFRQSEVNGGLAGPGGEIPTTLNRRQAALRSRASCRSSIGDFTAGKGAFSGLSKWRVEGGELLVESC